MSRVWKNLPQAEFDKTLRLWKDEQEHSKHLEAEWQMRLCDKRILHIWSQASNSLLRRNPQDGYRQRAMSHQFLGSMISFIGFPTMLNTQKGEGGNVLRDVRSKVCTGD